MSTITLGKSESGNVTMDIDRLIVSRALITASSGGGKSWLLRRLLEQVSATTQTIVLDPEGEFASLRELRDMVLVGADGDLPADPRAAGLLARRLMEMNVSAVIDLFELPLHQRREFVANFCMAMVDMPKELWRKCFIAIDEAHVFAPEVDAKCVSREPVAYLFSKGRKRGYCPIIATQRLANLSKDVAAECKNRFIGQMSLDNDQKRAADFLGWGKDRWKDLRDLSPPGHEGEWFAIGNAFNDRGVIKFRAGAVKTTHPEAGVTTASQPPQPSKKIAGILGELKDLAAQANEEARTLDEARRQIADLQRQIKDAAKPKIVEVPSSKEKRTIHTLRKALEDAMKVIANINTIGFTNSTSADQIKAAMDAAAQQIVKMVEADLAKKNVAFDKLKREATQIVDRLAALLQADVAVDVNLQKATAITVTPVPPTRPTSPMRTESSAGPNGLDKPGRAVLAVLAQHPEGCKKGKLSLLAGYKWSGGFRNTLSALRSCGLITGSNQEVMHLTQEGQVAAAGVEPMPTGQARRNYWLAHSSFGKAERDTLGVLVAIYPDAVDKDELCRRTGYAWSGGFRNTLGTLRTAGLLTGSNGGQMKASDYLFEE